MKVPSEAELAAALTILEGNCYKRILPGDCVEYLVRADHSLIDNPYNIALATNKTITLWVKKSILDGRNWERRAAYYRFFFQTAKVSVYPQFVPISDLYSSLVSAVQEVVQ